MVHTEANARTSQRSGLGAEDGHTPGTGPQLQGRSRTGTRESSTTRLPVGAPQHLSLNSGKFFRVRFDVLNFASQSAVLGQRRRVGFGQVSLADANHVPYQLWTETTHRR